MKTILVAVDSSDASDAVVAAAAELARPMGARIVVATVVQMPIFPSEYSAMITNLGDIVAAGEKAAADRLQRVYQRLAGDGIACESVQRQGAPVPIILDLAREKQADYLVMGSHGHTAFYDLLVGSTTHGVLLRAPCPVVIVPPAGKREPR